MANHLKMANIQSIMSLRERGWSCRRIARELGIHRDTVSRYVKEHEFQNRPHPPAGSGDQFDSKPANLPTGSNVQSDSKPANLPTGSNGQSDSKPAKVPAGSNGIKSKCEPHREFIKECIDNGLTSQRIWQDLKTEQGFDGSYDSVKRFARTIKPNSELPFRRMECGPGEEAQVDFGTGAFVIGRDGKRRRTHVFRVVLSHSRKGYSESVFRQTTEDFIRCLENAFYHFGGVPKTLVIDNLRAAVIKADWYEPELNPKLPAFCEHYNTIVLPTRPYTPRHKGKIERGVGYVKGNALKGRTFKSLEEQNAFLLHWETTVADTRIHGTTRKQVKKVFEEVEIFALKNLPADRFPFFREAERKVHRDGHVEVERAYYSTPPEYLGRKVWVRWDSRMVRIFNHRMEQIAIHVRVEPGKFSTIGQHIHDEKISGVERGSAELLKRAARIGTHSAAWTEQMIKNRGVEGIRVLIGFLNLAKRHQISEIEQACEVASSYRAYRLRTVKELIKRRAPKQEQFEFIEEHRIIRPLSEYQAIVKEVFDKE